MLYSLKEEHMQSEIQTKIAIMYSLKEEHIHLDIQMKKPCDDM